jgi:sterol 14-demethylase
VLQNLIDARYRDGRPTTEGEVTGLILALIFAGKHTSSTTGTWTGAHLLSNPVCLAAAVEEQEQILMKHGQNIDYNVLQEMDVLYRCIKETIRMHPVAEPGILVKGGNLLHHYYLLVRNISEY